MSHRCDKKGHKVKRRRLMFRPKKPTPLQAMEAREAEKAKKEGMKDE